jgi:hypothetical protein
VQSFLGTVTVWLRTGLSQFAAFNAILIFMPKGPRGQKRPADVIGNAVHVMRIATEQIEDKTPASEGKGYARKGGLAGGKARAKALTPEQRAEIARRAAEARWKKS